MSRNKRVAIVDIQANKNISMVSWFLFTDQKCKRQPSWTKPRRAWNDSSGGWSAAVANAAGSGWCPWTQSWHCWQCHCIGWVKHINTRLRLTHDGAQHNVDSYQPMRADDDQKRKSILSHSANKMAVIIRRIQTNSKLCAQQLSWPEQRRKNKHNIKLTQNKNNTHERNTKDTNQNKQESTQSFKRIE